MKKLFLTSFVFTTGSNECKEQRLVVASDLDAAYKKALAWFPENYPESEFISCIVHPAIEDERENPLSAPANYDLSTIFKELKFGRPAASQKFLDDCISRLDSE